LRETCDFKCDICLRLLLSDLFNLDSYSKILPAEKPGSGGLSLNIGKMLYSLLLTEDNFFDTAALDGEVFMAVSSASFFDISSFNLDSAAE
jgi:hypothetical protein